MRVLCASLLMLICSCASGTTCDSAPGNLSGTCAFSNGQCVEWANLGNSDSKSTNAICASNSGTMLAGARGTSGRLGTCTVPPVGSNSGINCSPSPGERDLKHEYRDAIDAALFHGGTVRLLRREGPSAFRLSLSYKKADLRVPSISKTRAR